MYSLSVYVDIGANSGDTATLAFAFSAAVTNTNRLFDIKVTQVECNNPNRCVVKVNIKQIGFYSLGKFKLSDRGTHVACSTTLAARGASRPSTMETPTTTTSTTSSKI